MTDDSEGYVPAFPVTAGQQVYATGMTLRDWFAGQALSNMAIGNTAIDTDWFHQIGAKHAYAIADAMIAARGK